MCNVSNRFISERWKLGACQCGDRHTGGAGEMSRFDLKNIFLCNPNQELISRSWDYNIASAISTGEIEKNQQIASNCNSKQPDGSDDSRHFTRRSRNVAFASSDPLPLMKLRMDPFSFVGPSEDAKARGAMVCAVDCHMSSAVHHTERENVE